MEIDAVTRIAFVIAGSLSFLLTGIMAAQVRAGKIHWSFIFASSVHGFWLFSIGLGHMLSFSMTEVLLFEVAHYCAWIYAALVAIDFYCKGALPKKYRLLLFGVCSALITFDVCHIWLSLGWFSTYGLIISQGIFLSIAALLSLEQLYRNILTIRLIKLFCLSLAFMFIYDVYFFSQSWMKPELNTAFFQLRAVLSIVASVFMGVAAAALQNNHDQPARLSLSRPAVFYTASLTMTGVVLSIVSLGGYYVGSYGGEWGFVAYAFILLAAVVSLVAVFASSFIRERLRVIINKHIFSHKYDYRQEWLRLIERLSQPASAGGIHHNAINSVASIFKSTGGAIWLRRGKLFVPVYQERLAVNISDSIEPEDSSFVLAMERDEWVFFPGSDTHGSLAQKNEHLPGWATSLKGVWLLLPLLNESRLTGFIALTRPGRGDLLSWEDLDLLKTVGRQVANYLERHEQVDQLAEARQFEAFNKLSAYVMHDLKNLIAQQALVVKNAEKHKDNPAFVEDAIATIQNSVGRMNNLLRKLQHNEPDGVRTLKLSEVLLDGVRRCQKGLPHPTLRNDLLSMRVKGDNESLVMVFVHIIQNAQDATEDGGFIDITVTREQNSAVINFEDNGEGMAPEFVRDRLFKPFETTKTGTGMGIGVYQARDYIQTLGGRVSVESAKGEGTSFVIIIPLVGD